MTTDLRQTSQYAQYMATLGWQTAKVNGDYLYFRKLPLAGNVGKFQRPHKFPTEEQLITLKESYRISVLYFEPQLPLPPKFPQLIKARSTFLPPKTIHIDLTIPEETLLKAMKPKTRYNIGLAARRGVIIKNSTLINEFTNLWQSSARKRGMWLPQKKEIKALWSAFGDKAHLLLAHYAEKPIAGVLLVESPKIMYYIYAGSTSEGKKLFAPTLLAWEAIRLAKKKKKKLFDFEGIYDPRYPSTREWRGFTKFKEGFGGKVVEYPPTLVYYSNPFLKLLNI
ncbi:MAG: peptidoglycan bridge formation glycyltransferase FemA/FemB family protein [Candidatus Blackburnbacteria bacterium]|nr:peptidoglycan bridge formation glycyltransferase FemA/FemB family protein [Candidatus Blackburnbacteria bacterium]